MTAPRANCEDQIMHNESDSGLAVCLQGRFTTFAMLYRRASLTNLPSQMHRESEDQILFGILATDRTRLGHSIPLRSP